MTTEQEGNWGQFARDIEVKLKGVNMLETLIQDLELNHEYCTKETILQAAAELRRLSTAQEPVCWMYDWKNAGLAVTDWVTSDKGEAYAKGHSNIRPLYTEPPKR